MSYTTASTDDVDSVMDPEYGGMWFLRDALDAEQLGLSIVELEPGARGRPHDHAGDGHEEIYCVVDGEVEIELGEETVALGRNEAIRVAPDQRRQLFNRADERARLVVAGAP